MPKRGDSRGVNGPRPRQTAVRRRRRTGGFLPSQITNLLAWYDFGDPATLFTDTGRTTLVASDADVIKGVTDKSGSAKHLSEATNGPAYKVGIQNGRSVARFDGTNDVLISAAVTQNQPLTVFVVADIIAYENAGASNTELFDADTNRCIIYAGTDGSTPWAYYAGAVQTSSATRDLNCNVHAAVFNGASSSQRLNGASIGTGNPGTTGISTTIILGRDSTTNFYNVDFAEVLVYSAALATADITRVEKYLGAKWGVTVA